MLPGGPEILARYGRADFGHWKDAGQAVRNRPATGSVTNEKTSSVAEGEQLGHRGPVAGGPGGGRAGGPAKQEQGKLAAAEAVGGVHVQDAPGDLGGVLAAAPLRGPPLSRLDGFRR